jgi:hypothetical protein
MASDPVIRGAKNTRFIPFRSIFPLFLGMHAAQVSLHFKMEVELYPSWWNTKHRTFMKQAIIMSRYKLPVIVSLVKRMVYIPFTTKWHQDFWEILFMLDGDFLDIRHRCCGGSFCH